jgi:FlaA1/EpsC-like NDP-sugar epimerase
MLDGKSLLVTGGTGSFGNDFVKLAITAYKPERIVIFSRDEKKQHDMRLSYNDDRLEFCIGDIRDRDQIHRAMRGVDYVFHAAALKQVPSCEFFPMEAVQTNVIGTQNVIDAAESCGVTKLVVLSTDKAVYPINAMGQTKALMEKLVLARARSGQTKTIMCGVRYGNVMYSRGSVIPLFIKQIKEGKPLTITHPDMTRLLLPLAQAVDLVAFALEHGEPGDFFVRKAPGATVGDLAQGTLNLFGATNPIQTIGIREGEKMHEMLVTSEELVRSDDFGDYYRISCNQRQDYSDFYSRGILSTQFAQEGYTSKNAPQLNVADVEQLLLELPEVRADLQGHVPNQLKVKKSA